MYCSGQLYQSCCTLHALTGGHQLAVGKKFEALKARREADLNQRRQMLAEKLHAEEAAMQVCVSMCVCLGVGGGAHAHACPCSVM